jgi:hypothetical protein
MIVTICTVSSKACTGDKISAEQEQIYSIFFLICANLRRSADNFFSVERADPR